MRGFFTAITVLFAATPFCFSQSIVEIPLSQNPVFEVYTNDVNIVLPEGQGNLTLGGDIVVKGGSGTYGFKWYTQQGETLSTESLLTVTKEGVYLLDVTDTCDCLLTVRFDITTAGVDSVSDEKIVIYPNPTDGTIKFYGIEVVQFTAIDMSGRLRSLIDLDGEIFREVDLSGLTPGLYIVSLTDINGVVHTDRIIRK